MKFPLDCKESFESSFIFWLTRYVKFKLSSLSNKELRDPKALASVNFALSREIKNIEQLDGLVKSARNAGLTGINTYFNPLKKIYETMKFYELSSLKQIDEELLSEILASTTGGLSDASKKNYRISVINFFAFLDKQNEEDGKYELEGKKFSSDELISYYEKLCEKYPIFSIEDGLSEDDWSGWAELTKRLGSKVQLVGDDLFVTNEKILREGIEKNIANAILIKPNQIGSVTQTMQTVRLAQRNGYRCIMSHRSGESEDAFIADFAVALNTGEIKTGATSRSERNAKYNRLLEIELEAGEFLGDNI